jgi:hypothetical protein
VGHGWDEASEEAIEPLIRHVRRMSGVSVSRYAGLHTAEGSGAACHITL